MAIESSPASAPEGYIQLGHCIYRLRISLPAHGNCAEGTIGNLVTETERWPRGLALFTCTDCKQDIALHPQGVCL